MTYNYGKGAIMRRLACASGLALLCVLTPGVAHGQNTQAQRALAHFVDSTYVVRAGDILRVHIYGYPSPDASLDGNFPVENSGMVTLPLVGAVSVAGHTGPQVQAIVRARYATEQQTPVVLVDPVFAVSVIGEVPVPGTIDVYPGYTIFDALSISGGFKDFAVRKKVLLVREGRTIEVGANSNDEAVRVLAETRLQSGDRIVVMRGKPASLSTILSVMQILLGTLTLITVARK